MSSRSRCAWLSPCLYLLSAIAMIAPATIQAQAIDFELPFRLRANKHLIDVDGGHAAPFVTDFDGDGTDDLVVGQFEGGQLNLFRNIGTNQRRRYADSQLLKIGEKLGKVPFG